MRPGETPRTGERVRMDWLAEGEHSLTIVHFGSRKLPMSSMSTEDQRDFCNSLPLKDSSVLLETIESNTRAITIPTLKLAAKYDLIKIQAIGLKTTCNHRLVDMGSLLGSDGSPEEVQSSYSNIQG